MTKPSLEMSIKKKQTENCRCLEFNSEKLIHHASLLASSCMVFAEALMVYLLHWSKQQTKLKYM